MHPELTDPATSATQIILLPGLDGTARLFDRFIQAAPNGARLVPIALPAEPLTYTELADKISALLPNGRLAIVAESYSGPLAVAIAARRPIAGLILCNTFVVAPRARVLRWLAVPMVLKLRPPVAFLRRHMVGQQADDALVREIAAVAASVPPSILASRVRSVLSVDSAAEFAHLTAPTLYLRGIDDRLVPDSAFRTMAALRDIEIARVPGPHLLLQANPTASWQAILTFLESLA